MLNAGGLYSRFSSIAIVQFFCFNFFFLANTHLVSCHSMLVAVFTEGYNFVHTSFFLPGKQLCFWVTEIVKTVSIENQICADLESRLTSLWFISCKILTCKIFIIKLQFSPATPEVDHLCIVLGTFPLWSPFCSNLCCSAPCQMFLLLQQLPVISSNCSSHPEAHLLISSSFEWVVSRFKEQYS